MFFLLKDSEFDSLKVLIVLLIFIQTLVTDSFFFQIIFLSIV